MAENTPLPIANGFYLSDAPVISAQQCINYYPNVVTAPALSQETLYGTAGINQLTTTGTLLQQGRGSITVQGIPYYVNGESLYRLNRPTQNPDTFTYTNLGTIEGSGRVSLATNGTQIVIQVPGGKGSLYNVGTMAFTPDIEAVDGDFTANGAPQYVVYVDGYFLFTTDEKKFIVSSLNNGLAYSALDFGTAEADPDDIVGVVVYFNQVFILGTQTIEGFENIGGSGFPFQRNGLIDDTGCLAPFSIVKGDDAFRFLGSSKNEGPGVYEFKGNGAYKISNTAMDTIFQDATDAELSAVFGVHYGQNGQFFTAFTLTGKDQSFEYNAISQRWHQRKSTIGGAQLAWRVSSVEAAYGRLICNDLIDGRIGEMDEDIYTEYTNPILRRVDTMPFSANGNAFTVSSLELTPRSGVGNTAVADPEIRMFRSIDGGNTFGDPLPRKLGKIGEYYKRCIWRRLGRVGRFEMFRFEMSDAVAPAIVKLQARFHGGMR
jgi:hypothetical protein